MKPGGHLESLIQKTGDRLSRRQIARLFKWPTPVIQTGIQEACPNCGSYRWSTKLVHTARTGFDFFGYSASGRFIAIEAKESFRRRLPVNVETGDGLHAHQAIALREVSRAGGIALIVWMRTDNVAVFSIEEASKKIRSLEWLDKRERVYSEETGILGLLWPELPDPDYPGGVGLGARS